MYKKASVKKVIQDCSVRVLVSLGRRFTIRSCRMHIVATAKIITSKLTVFVVLYMACFNLGLSILCAFLLRRVGNKSVFLLFSKD